MRDGGHTDVVDCDLMLNLRDVHSVWLAEIHNVLNACIQYNAVKIRMPLGYSMLEVSFRYSVRENPRMVVRHSLEMAKEERAYQVLGRCAIAWAR